MSIESILSTITEKAKNASALGNTLKFDMGGETVYIDGTGAENAVSAENKDADCTINISKEDFQSILSGDMNPMGAFMSGKIKVKGDMGVAMKLQNLLA